jgi:drug/metabolite transporter (DMT)-like permease
VAATLAVGAIVVITRKWSLSEPAALWGVAAGIELVIGSLVFYAALGAGAMSLVAPLTACGSVVPAGVAIAAGESLSAPVVIGMVLALGGAVAVARISSGPAKLSSSVLALAAGGAVLAGVGLTFLQQAVAHGGQVLAIALVQRGIAAGGLLIVMLAATQRYPDRLAIPDLKVLQLIVVVGVADASANIAFALASREGGDAIVAVIASLYAAVTVLWAGIVLRERLSARQVAAIAVALVGVGLISGGA